MMTMLPHRRTRVSIVAVAALVVAATAAGDWPSDPESPLLVGPAETLIVQRHATADDGATWITWLDALCFPQTRVQRVDAAGNVLVEGGIALVTPDLCGVTDVQLAVAPDGSALVRGGGAWASLVTHRIAADGTLLWGAQGITTSWNGAVGGMLGLPGGDALLAGHTTLMIHVSRHALDGSEVWTTSFDSIGGARRVIAVVPDETGGAYVVWDQSIAYTRMIRAMRITADGARMWPAPITVVPPDPSSSRHSEPGIVADGRGGVAIVFVRGAEQGSTPVPLLLQRLRPDGTLAFDVQGVRVSLDSERQFDPIVERDEATGEVIIAWKSGLFDPSVRAQRMTMNGARLWGDTGVHVTAFDTLEFDRYDATWSGTTLDVVVSDPQPGMASVRATRVNGAGAVVEPSIALSGATETATIAAASTGAALTVSWFEAGEGIAGDVVAQRVNGDGSLGLLPGDVDGDGAVGFGDLAAVLSRWGPCAACPADLDGDGVVGIADLLVVLSNWG